MIEVLAPGLQTTVQDSGRPGLRALGVGPAGAADAGALRLANALVGNDEHAAGLEITLAGPTLRFTRATLVALRGASLDARIGSRALPADRPVWLSAGAEIELRAATRGARAYLAVGGGISVRPRLGSRATDLGAGFGGFKGRALRRGDALPTGSARARHAALRAALDASGDVFAAPPWWIAPPPLSEPATLRVLDGRHADRLDAGSRARWLGPEWRVGRDSNRMGLRLEGAALALDAPLELVSEGVSAGTVQLPRDGQPVALGVDAQTVGGYPRIAHVISADLDLLAQLRAGARVRFERVDLKAARSAWLAREQGIARMIEAIRAKLRT